METIPKFCFHCGAALPTGARFCAQCGRSLSPAEPSASANVQVPARRRPAGLIFAGALLVLGLGMGAVLLWQARQPRVVPTPGPGLATPLTRSQTTQNAQIPIAGVQLESSPAADLGDRGVDLNLQIIVYGYPTQGARPKSGTALIQAGKLGGIQGVDFLGAGAQFSPDGRLIAYDNCDGRIYISRPDGNNKRRINNVGGGECRSDWRWSPDGTKLSYFAPGGSQGHRLHIMDLNSGQDKAVPNVHGVDWHWWSPDGNEIVYGQDVNADQIIRLLYITDLKGNSRQLTQAENFVPCARDLDKVDTWAPAWSPDGQTIAFTQCGKLFTISPAGTDLQQLTEPIYAYSPRWSPDGKWILFLANEALLAISPDGQVTHEIGRLPFTGGPFSIGPLNR